jgi:hypothetical protein
MKRKQILKSKVKGLDYRHYVVIEAFGGRVKTTVRGFNSLNTWTNVRQNGVTVRVDHAYTLRFDDAKIVERSQ